jgi:hypothetical protein
LGDFIIDANVISINKKPIINFIWGWLPGIQLIRGSEGTDKPITTFWPIDFHVPIYRTKEIYPHIYEW